MSHRVGYHHNNTIWALTCDVDTKNCQGHQDNPSGYFKVKGTFSRLSVTRMTSTESFLVVPCLLLSNHNRKQLWLLTKLTEGIQEIRFVRAPSTSSAFQSKLWPRRERERSVLTYLPQDPFITWGLCGLYCLTEMLCSISTCLMQVNLVNTDWITWEAEYLIYFSVCSSHTALWINRTARKACRNSNNVDMTYWHVLRLLSDFMCEAI